MTTANTQEHPCTAIINRLQINAESPSLYADLWCLLVMTRAAYPALFDPSKGTPVDDFISRLEDSGIGRETLPVQRITKVLNNLREKWRR